MPAPSRVLVTGARGFLGCQLIAELLRRYAGVEIVAVSRRPASANDHPGPALDLSQAATWRELGSHFDWVIHLAARLPSSQGAATDDAFYRANVLPSLHMIEAAQRWRPSRLIYISSIAIYPMGAAAVLHEGLVPRPNTLYGAAKLAGEHLAALTTASGAGVTTLRLSSLYGPGQPFGTVLPLFIANAAAGKPISLIAGGARTQDFLHVADAARGIVDAAASQATGTYNLASGAATSMLELARAITALPRWEVEIVDRGGTEHCPSVKVDISKAQRDWGYAPGIPFREGIGSYHASLLAGMP